MNSVNENYLYESQINKICTQRKMGGGIKGEKVGEKERK